ncbi:MAG: glucose-1-phosphate adenylyltransferase subunit GlgD [Lachnospiraceae bacterium]|nr:glucose-1-phosphate adenylyltransferase subunit GlgD [Candidatus Equihabitans merdae]
MRAVGIILAGGNTKRMKALSDKRAVAAMPIAGSYRSIDFALSNMTNSHVQKVAVLTQYNSRSLNEHLSSSKWWNFGRKQGGLFVFPPTITTTNSYWYRGTADAMAQNISWLKECHEPYVIISPGDCIYKLDFNRILEFHIAKRADITVVSKEIYNEDVTRFGVIKVNDDDRIVEFNEKPMISNEHLISTGVYVLRRHLLIELLEKTAMEDRYDFVQDILMRYKDLKRIYSYKMVSYWSNIATVDSYFRTNMDFLNPETRAHFWHDEPTIYTKIDDNPPAKYNPPSSVRNALVASGCIINGHVEDAILFKNVFVGSNCTIRNAIILNGVHISDNCCIQNCIVESGTTIAPGSVYVGENEIKIVT